MFKLYEKWFELEEILEPNYIIHTNKNIEYVMLPCSFDIEASSFYDKEQKAATMYAWVFGINGKCIRGRKWDQFLKVLTKVIDYYELGCNRRLILYVHNLSYEFQWFRKLFEWEKVFSIDNRKPIYAITNIGIEFRCSYLLSNMSLENVAKNLLKYKVSKMVGDLDYRLIRHSYTYLSDKEWRYILHDGLVVMAYIQELYENYGYDLPLTNTGFVRNYCREVCIRGENRYKYQKLIKDLILTKSEYLLLNQVFAGGFTHANPNYINKIIDNVDSYDFTSSYPYVMVSSLFPMSRGQRYKPLNKEDFITKLNNYCCIIDISFDNIYSIIDFDNFISKSKCFDLEDDLCNNGRIVKAKHLRICITNVDFAVICKTYKWSKLSINNMYIYQKSYLPKPIIISILKFYEDKTTLKGVEGREADYMNGKNKLNSIYGMMVTNIIRDENIYDGMWHTEKVDIKTEIDKYNKNNNRFLSYAWGVFVTSYAKYNLWTGILEFKEDYIYSDTDSIKVVNIQKHEKYLKKYNENVLKNLKEVSKFYKIPFNKFTPKNKDGKISIMGEWDHDGQYERFKTLGAKRYMYQQDNMIHLTISGVSKKVGVEYLYYKYKTNDKIFKAFKDDLIFPAEYEVKDGKEFIKKLGSGKLTHTYIDDEQKGYVKDYNGMLSEYHELSSIYMEPSSYELSLDSLFMDYLLSINNDYILK